MLWRGQCLRVATQQRALALIHEGLQNKWERPREAVVVMDFKMKYLPQYYRQKSTEHFGKRGMSWHGFLVIFYVYNPSTRDVERQHVYCDPILKGTNKQDGLAIAALVEIFLRQLKATPFFSALQRISIQSDNAAYYHAKYLILALPYIGRAVGLVVVRYIHTETCDGKGLIDAHFAMAMRFVDAYIGMGNNATGPDEVFHALVKRPIPNTFTQLVMVDRERLEKRYAKYSRVWECMKVIPRMNEITYMFHDPFDDATVHDDDDDPFAAAPTVRLEASLFSNIGTPASWLVSPGDENAPVWRLSSGAGNASMQVDGGVDGNSDGESEGGADVCTDSEVDEDEVVDDDDEGAVILSSDDEDGAGSPTAATEEDNSHPVVRAFGAALVQASMLMTLRHEEEHRRQLMQLERRAVRDGFANVYDYVESELQQMGQPAVSTDIHATDESAVQERRRDVVAFCIRSAKQVLEQHGYDTDHRDGRAEQEEYALAKNVDLTVHQRLCAPGWAQRPKRGKNRGSKAVAPKYLKSLAEFFAAEGKDKQHASWFRADLIRKHQGQLDYPTEQDVRNLVTRCYTYRNKVTAYNAEHPDEQDIHPDYVGLLMHGTSQLPKGSGGGPRSQLPDDQETFIQAHAHLTAQKVWDLAMGEAFQDALDKTKFCKRVTNVRSAAKKAQGPDVVGQRGPLSRLPDDQEAFIQAHAHLTAKKVLDLAMGEAFQDALNKTKFCRRVTNVRSAANKAQGKKAKTKTSSAI